MNKQLLYSTILTCFGTLSLFAQISIRENNVVEKPVLKPKQFDSLTNFIEQKNIIDYKKYIGYKLYFLPKSKKYNQKNGSIDNNYIIDFLFSNDTVQITKEGKIPFEELILTKIYGDPKKLKGEALKKYNVKKKEYETIDIEKTNIYKPHFYYLSTDKTDGKISGEIRTLPDSVSGKYYTIIDIRGKGDSYSKKDDYKKLEEVDFASDRTWQLGLKITLRNESNQDILFWIVKQARFIASSPFFLVPYYEKQRNLYLNKNLVLKYEGRTNRDLENLIDVNTGRIVNIKYGEVWNCSDISFIDSKDSYYLTCFYFLKNGDREVKIKLDSSLIKEYFMLETEFKHQELEKLKKEELRIKEEQALLKREQQKKIKFKQDCISKWGAQLGGYISEGKVVLGMKKEMCIASWGEPIYINRTIVRGLTSEQWVYGWGTYLYFDNGTLRTIQN